MRIQTIAWYKGAIRIVDQTQLPHAFVYRSINDIRTLWEAIHRLRVRGAPALGAAAALGVYMGIKDIQATSCTVLLRKVDKVVAYLASSRPTARNLFWGLERMRRCAQQSAHLTPAVVKSRLLDEALLVIEEDKAACRSMGKHGQALLRNGDTVMTICNTGALATIDYGTALGVIYAAKEHGKSISVYACETRPLLQGARLTTWELARNHIDVTLICDSMAASVMSRGNIRCVIAGADRIAANGDTANKIGTYALAVACRYHRIPFYIAAPLSTFDLTLTDGSHIPIEQRDGREITEMFYKHRMAAPGIKTYNPAFDVTPHQLISGIITEKGILKTPYKNSIRTCASTRKV